LHRKLKIVLRLEPADGGLRALVAVGADDCDPELCVLQAAGLSDVLQFLPGLLATAEIRSESQARYPMVPRPRIERNQATGARRPAPPTTAPNAVTVTSAPSLPAAQG